VFAILLSLVQVLSADTVAVSRLEQSPSPSITIDSARLGSPQVKISTRQRPALVWLLRAGDTVFIAASISDTSQYWGDDFVSVSTPEERAQPILSMRTSSGIFGVPSTAASCTGGGTATGNRREMIPTGG
jgi:hypothetical protein